MPDEVTALYRPVGQAELDLIRASGFREFPPRLPEQPIFYPVLTEQYATQIARDWNTERCGFRSCRRTAYLGGYEFHTVGSAEHCEYWVPAADLKKFNDNIVGKIEVIAEFHGSDLAAGGTINPSATAEGERATRLFFFHPV